MQNELLQERSDGTKNLQSCYLLLTKPGLKKKLVSAIKNALLEAKKLLHIFKN